MPAPPEPTPWYLDRTHPKYLARVDRDRAAYIEGTGRYPEDEWPDNPDYHRFRDEPRPHRGFLLWLVRQLGTGDDQLPIGIT